MRRADRLFAIVQALRRRPVVTAAALARELEVSERTIYRDIRDLAGTGVPIDGEAGVGYTLRKGFDLPPLMFTEGELEALVLGARVVESWGDAGLGKAAQAAIARIEAAVPVRLREGMERIPLFAPGFLVRPEVAAHLSELRGAVEQQRRTWMVYRDGSGDESERVVRPLGLFFWGATWAVGGWCELREDFRTFRLDRVDTLRVLPERFEATPGRTLEDFFVAVRADNG